MLIRIRKISTTRIGFKSANVVLHGLFRAEKNGVCFVEAVFKNGELHGEPGKRIH